MTVPSESFEPESLSYTLERFCDAFEGSLRTGTPSPIESILAEAPEGIAEELLRELIHIEIEYRTSLGEASDVGDYVSRFPDQAELVEAVFEETQRAGTSRPTDPFGTKVQETFVAPSTAMKPPWLSKGKFTPKHFGNYLLLEEIARGGMGVVYRAEDPALSRPVAIKMILAGEFASDELVERFYSEAKAAAVLDHPGIVPIYEVGECQGQPYFSMAYIDGDSLAERVRDKTFGGPEAARVVRDVSLAVQYAHEQGIIHRDLKPANVLIDKAGKPRVTDFGLAKHIQDADELTLTGQILGTPAYMAPEQASGAGTEFGPAIDIYSLGGILYCLVCGRPPFQAATISETLRQVIEREPVPPRELNPAVDRDLETICLKCLSKERQRRYESAGDLADDLVRFLKGMPIQARPVSRREKYWRTCRRHPVPSLLALLASVLLLILAIGGPLMAIRQRSLTKAAKLSASNAELAREKEAEAARVAETLRREEQRLRSLADESRRNAEVAERLAKQEAETARQTSEFLVRLFQESDPFGFSTASFGFADAGSADQTARQILDRGAERIGKELSDRPLVQAKLMVTIGGVYLMIGALEEGETLLHQALKTLEGDESGVFRLVTAEAHHQLGTLHAIAGDFDKSADFLRRAVAARSELLGADDLKTAESQFVLAWPLAENGHAIDDKEMLSEARGLLEDALRKRQAVFGKGHAETANSQVALGALLFHQGDYLGAVSLIGQARVTFFRLGISDNFASALGSLIESEVALQGGDSEAATRSAEEAVEVAVRLLGSDHPFSFILRLHVARILAGDDIPQRIASYREIVDASRRVPGRPLRDAVLLQTLGHELVHVDDFEGAEEAMASSLQIRLARLGTRHWRVADCWTELAWLERKRGNDERAESLLRKAFDVYLENGVIDRRWHGAECTRYLNELLQEQGRPAEIAKLQQRIDQWRRSD